MTCDVLVAGGGPGGCAAALSLRAHAPGLSVVLVEASGYGTARIGETLPPAARTVLGHLGVWDAFVAQGHREAYGSAAAWGGAAAEENDFWLAARGHAGWHLDRAAFDGMLACQAEQRGATVMREERVVRAERGGEGWMVSLGSGETVRARFLVDATGPGAVLARRLGARPRALDRLAGFVRFFREGPGAPGDGRTLVEAFADGWWYTAGLPNGLRVAALMTDSDLARGLGAGEPSRWPALLEAAPLTRASLDGAEPVGGLVVRTARSRRLEPAAGDGWLAVGDAASAFDPLSSQGMLKALRSGVFASYAIGDVLVRGDAGGLEKYRGFVEAEFAAYARVRARYYAEEGRWAEGEFWARRRETAAPSIMAHDGPSGG